MEFSELPNYSPSLLTRRLQKFVPAGNKRLKTEHLVLVPARTGMSLCSLPVHFALISFLCRWGSVAFGRRPQLPLRATRAGVAKYGSRQTGYTFIAGARVPYR